MCRGPKRNRGPRFKWKYRKFNWSCDVALSCCAVGGQIKYFEILRDFMYEIGVHCGLLDCEGQRERVETIVVDDAGNSAASSSNQAHCLG